VSKPPAQKFAVGAVGRHKHDIVHLHAAVSRVELATRSQTAVHLLRVVSLWTVAQQQSEAGAQRIASGFERAEAHDAATAQTALEIDPEFFVDDVRRKSAPGRRTGSGNDNLVPLLVVREQRSAVDRDAGGAVKRPDAIATAAIEKNAGRHKTKLDAFVAWSAAVLVSPDEHSFHCRRNIITLVDSDKFDTVPRHALQPDAVVGTIYLQKYRIIQVVAAVQCLLNATRKCRPLAIGRVIHATANVRYLLFWHCGWLSFRQRQLLYRAHFAPSFWKQCRKILVSFIFKHSRSIESRYFNHNDDIYCGE